jgi:hypothetical protein
MRDTVDVTMSLALAMLINTFYDLPPTFPRLVAETSQIFLQDTHILPIDFALGNTTSMEERES